jgi:hypothetical protein
MKRSVFMLLLLALFGATSIRLSALQSPCPIGDPASITGQHCKSEFDGGVAVRSGVSSVPVPDAIIMPDAMRTPGVTNPLVTQANLAQTICNKAFKTDEYRPRTSYTDPLKTVQLGEYGDTVSDPGKKCMAHSNNTGCYEEDHLISLEVGGDPFDPRNLWPEPTKKTKEGRKAVGIGFESKDQVENYLHNAVCLDLPKPKLHGKKPPHSMPLKQAQEILAHDWFACYEAMLLKEDCH